MRTFRETFPITLPNVIIAVLATSLGIFAAVNTKVKFTRDDDPVASIPICPEPQKLVCPEPPVVECPICQVCEECLACPSIPKCPIVPKFQKCAPPVECKESIESSKLDIIEKVYPYMP
jgi:hypothetical protein